MISESTIAKLRNLVREFENREGTLCEVQQTSNNCTDCYSNGGCKGTCRGTCISKCAATSNRY